MRGEELHEAFVGFAGGYGDRLFAFRSAARPKGFPYLTGREQMNMLLYRPHFRHPDRAAKPANLAEAESIAPGLNPVSADPADLAVDVETPSGEVLAVDDAKLTLKLGERLGKEEALTLMPAGMTRPACPPPSRSPATATPPLSQELRTHLPE